ncbi:MAG TPA: SUMF1/EgtB/PvdO family nonheme iron enzyme [Polyangiaceae bacterium]|nr:SUMF1/EgtB/PvdO family nonheme iron enzyme [Polyangiaceae bacterium]
MRRTRERRHGPLQQVGALVLGGMIVGLMMPYPGSRQVRSTPLPPTAGADPASPDLPLAARTNLRREQNLEKPPVLTPSSEPSAPAMPGVSTGCPTDMVLVEGEYCTDVRHTCEHWLDDEKLPFARCGRYARQALCVGKRVPKRFCIDRFESADADGVPVNHQSFQLARQRCAGQGKRLCTESEWNFACEGEEMLPYPYGTTRQAVCNQDRSDLFENNPRRRILRDLRTANDPTSRCVSPFGVFNMVGNLDEPTLRETGQQPKFNNALKGGWWMAGRNRCRPATTAHDDYYKDMQVGVRCCAVPNAE